MQTVQINVDVIHVKVPIGAADAAYMHNCPHPSLLKLGFGVRSWSIRDRKFNGDCVMHLEVYATHYGFRQRVCGEGIPVQIMVGDPEMEIR